jgi:hypothetical protein
MFLHRGLIGGFNHLDGYYYGTVFGNASAKVRCDFVIIALELSGFHAQH